MPRPVSHRAGQLPHRVPRTGEVRRFRGELGQRAVAGPGRAPARLRRPDHAAGPPAAGARQDPDRAGAGLMAPAAPATAALRSTRLATTVVGSYSVPEWLSRPTTRFDQPPQSAPQLHAIALAS